jgi:hypothetical protein
MNLDVFGCRTAKLCKLDCWTVQTGLLKNKKKNRTGLRRGQCRRHRPLLRPYGQVYAEGIAVGVDLRLAAARSVPHVPAWPMQTPRVGRRRRRRRWQPRDAPRRSTARRWLPYAEGNAVGVWGAQLTATARVKPHRRHRQRTPTAVCQVPRDLNAEALCRGLPSA